METKTVTALFGPQLLYRVGRKMYMRARGEVPNDMHANGELLVQRSVLAVAGLDELVIFDVGANVGDWTRQLLAEEKKLGDRHRLSVYAFEPVPSTMNTLRQRLPTDRRDLHLEALALSGTAGVANIHVTEHSGINSLHPVAGQRSEQVSIRMSTATEFCNERGIAHVHLLKCDTEGHDMEVIRGAAPLLRAERISILQFEYNHRWVFSRNFLHDAFQAIEGLPYRLAKLQPDRLQLLKSWHPELEKFFEGNYALVHRDALPWVRAEEVTFDESNALVSG